MTDPIDWRRTHLRRLTACVVAASSICGITAALAVFTFQKGLPGYSLAFTTIAIFGAVISWALMLEVEILWSRHK